MPLLDDRYNISANTEYVKKYFVMIIFFIAIVIASVFFVFSFNATKLIREQMVSQAKSLFNGVMVTRLWIASHGGVYVPYNKDNPVSSYLVNIPGVSSIVKTDDGQQLMLKTPATSIREISDLSNMSSQLRMKITSLNPVNPQNAPDDFERKALMAFEKKAEDLFEFSDINGEKYFRYMAPLIVKEQCLKCHAQQGYQQGEVRGSLSIAIPANDILQKAESHQLYTVASGLALLILVGLLIHYIFKHFIREINDAQDKLLSSAITDFLTNTFNRRFGLKQLEKEISRSTRSKSNLSLCMFDLDHFKKINDTYGHLAGDTVLMKFAELLKSFFRDYDTVFRYGGEEFVAILTDTSGEEALVITERIRQKVEEFEIQYQDKVIRITVSIGVTEFIYGESIDKFISRADCLMYQAKDAGRNAVKSCGCVGVEPEV